MPWSVCMLDGLSGCRVDSGWLTEQPQSSRKWARSLPCGCPFDAAGGGRGMTPGPSVGQMLGLAGTVEWAVVPFTGRQTCSGGSGG